MGQVLFDETRWPLLVATFPSAWSDADFDAYLDKLRSNLDRTEAAATKTAILFDASSGLSANAAQRKRQAKWVEKNRADSARLCVGYAFVIQSAMVRGVLTAILWLSPMPAPHVVVSTREEAFEWLTQRLAEAGVTVPDAHSGVGE